MDEDCYRRLFVCLKTIRYFWWDVLAFPTELINYPSKEMRNFVLSSSKIAIVIWVCDIFAPKCFAVLPNIFNNVWKQDRFPSPGNPMKPQETSWAIFPLLVFIRPHHPCAGVRIMQRASRVVIWRGIWFHQPSQGFFMGLRCHMSLLAPI